MNLTFQPRRSDALLLLIILGVIALFVRGCSAQAQPMPVMDTTNPDVVLAWNAPTNPLVAGVNIRARSVLATNIVNAGTSTCLLVFNTVPGTGYHFAAQAYSAAGAVSAWSAEANWTNYLVTITNEIFQVWSTTNLLLNVQNPTWSTMFFRMSNGWLTAASSLKAPAWNNISQFASLTNKVRLRGTNILQFSRTP